MTLSKAQIKSMLASETETCESLLLDKSKKPVVKTKLKIPVDAFVERSYLLHRNLIDRWGGWRFKTDPLLVEDEAWSKKVVLEESQALIRQAGNLARDHQIRPEEAKVHFFCHLGDTTFEWAHLLLTKSFPERIFLGMGVDGPRYYNMPDADISVQIGYRHMSGQYPQTMIASIRKGQRTSAAVLRALESSQAPQPLIEAWATFFQRLGELAWVGQKVPVQVTMSCAPSSFLRLGMYGENSCYRNGGEGEYSKFWLAGDCPDSFVMLFHRLSDKKQDEEEEVKETVVAGRAWGVALPKRAALLGNFYQLQRGTILPIAVNVLEKSLGINGLKEYPSNTLDAVTGYPRWRSLLMSSVYANADVSFFSSSKTHSGTSLSERYLESIIKQSSQLGLYCRKGVGPAMLRQGTNVYTVSFTTKDFSGKKRLWPYQDADLVKLFHSAVEQHGIIQELIKDQ